MANTLALSKDSLDAMLLVLMSRLKNANFSQTAILLALVLVSLVSCVRFTTAQVTTDTAVAVDLIPIDVDPKHPERRNFGALTLLSAFQIESKDKRFGGLSGLSIGRDGKLYAVSDNGYWLSAKMEIDPNGVLLNLTDWQIAPILATTNTPVTGALRDAEALAVAKDGSFLVAFEGTHRISRYSPPPKTFASTPVSVNIPAAVARAPGNGGIEGLAVLPDGRLLALTEEFTNGDGSFKGWLIEKGQFAELAYFPSKGFRVTDCAGLSNGDVLVLERRYVPFGILSARLTLVKGNSLQPGAKLAGKELLKLEQPLAVQNFEAVAAQQTSKGTLIYIVSDDNYSPFQQTLLLQFLLPNTGN
jgi:hypothetical protein